MNVSHEIPVGIVSSHRTMETLYDTIRSLKNSGFSDFYIRYDHQRMGIWPHYQLVMREMAKRFADANAILIVEDDIVVCRDLHKYLLQLIDVLNHDDVGLMSLYISETSRKYHFLNSNEKINVTQRTEHVGGALAWLWNPTVLKKIAFADDLFRDDSMRTDVHAPNWLDKNNLKMLHHLPNLVQHADHGYSTYHNVQTVDHRQSDTFIGEETNALEFFGLNHET